MQRPGADPMRRLSRFGWLPLGVLLAGCVTTGESTVEAEIARRQGQAGIAVTEAAPERAVFIAKGAEVVVEPLDGHCLDEDSITVTGASGFAIVADCLTEPSRETKDGGDAAEAAEMSLRRGFPGILTMSISAQPAFGKNTNALSEFEALLTSPEGLRLVGRGDVPKPGEVVATRWIGGALYVLVEGPGTAGGILSRRFWRTFAGIKDRLVLMTVSGFRDREISDDAMLGVAVRQMRRLRRANAMPAVAEETEIIEAMTTDVLASGEVEFVSAGTGDDAEIGATAPDQAPQAPAKPGRRG